MPTNHVKMTECHTIIFPLGWEIQIASGKLQGDTIILGCCMLSLTGRLEYFHPKKKEGSKNNKF